MEHIAIHHVQVDNSLMMIKNAKIVHHLACNVKTFPLTVHSVLMGIIYMKQTV